MDAVTNAKRQTHWGLRAAVALMLVQGCYSGLSATASSSSDEGGSESGQVPNGDETGSGADDNDAGLLGPGVCRETFKEFRDEIWTKFMATDCAGCHNSAGLARGTRLILHDEARPGYLTENLQTLRTLSVGPGAEVDSPLLLTKMTGASNHGGGVRFAADSDEYAALEGLVRELAEPIECDGPSTLDVLTEKLERLDPLHTLRRAKFALVTEFPTAQEESRVVGGGWAAFDEVISEVMEGEAFAERVGEIYNEALLTDLYLLTGNELLFTIDEGVVPNRSWYDETDDPNGGRLGTIRGLTRAPIELVEHVVRESLPFSEVLLADYTMVNPFSAQMWSLDSLSFDDETDPQEFVPASVPGIPHAGVLTTHAFLNRYPDTDTNLNRHRSRTFFRLFQGVDVLRLSLQAIDVAAVDDENPTLTNNACAVCHAYIDPVASAFQDWDNKGNYRSADLLAEPWPEDIRGAGFNGVGLPADRSESRLRWLAEEAVANPRFSVAVVETLFAGLMRRKPLLEPTDPLSESYYPDIIAFAFEDAVIKAAAAEFSDSNYDIRRLVLSLLKSPLYRAVNLTPDADDADQAMLAKVGVAHPLRPTQLYAKLEAKTGYAWRPDGLGVASVQRTLELLFGEIDSRNTTTRLLESNGLFASYLERMADQVACRVVASEFGQEDEQRTLLPGISFSDSALNADGAAAVREGIRRLHDHLLDSRPPVDENEIDAAFALFVAIQEAGQAGIAAGTASTLLPQGCRSSWTVDGEPIPEALRLVGDPEFIARAWIGVITYLLADHRFTHE